MGKKTLIIHCFKLVSSAVLKGRCKALTRSNSEFSIALRNRPHKCMQFSFSHATKRNKFICVLLKASPWWGISVGDNKVSICAAWPSPQCWKGCIYDKYTQKTDCSTAGGELTGATNDLAFFRPKPSLNFSSSTLQRDDFRENGRKAK